MQPQQHLRRTGAPAAQRTGGPGPTLHAAAGHVARAEHQVGLVGGADQPGQVGRVVREVAVHLHQQLGSAAPARGAKPARYARPRPCLPGRCSTSTSGSSAASRSAICARAVGRVVVHHQDVVLGGRLGQPRQRGAHHLLEVVGLVVGGEDQPGAGHERPTLGRRVRNAEIASHFDELASLYELDGASSYRVVAYRTAAKNIRDSGASVAEMARQGKAESLPGIGKAIADKIGSLLEQGTIPSADKLKERIPPGLVEVTRIPGLGPKRVKVLHDHLGIGSLDELKEAAGGRRAGRRAGLRPQGPRQRAGRAGEGPRDPAPAARPGAGRRATRSSTGLRDEPAVLRVELAGSARRLADTVKDLDVVVAASDPKAVTEAFTKLPGAGVGERGRRGRRQGRDPQRAAGGPADRARGELRQPAPALHRLRAPQRGAADRGRAQGPARERVRDQGRRDRHHALLRRRSARSTRCWA